MAILECKNDGWLKTPKRNKKSHLSRKSRLICDEKNLK